MKTTIFVNNQRRDYQQAENCHGGSGPFHLKDVIGSLPQEDKQYIKFIHDDIIPPGSTFGHHQHRSDSPLEEWYYCLSGHGVMTLDDGEFAMGPGDTSCCYANGFHGLRNTGQEDMRILVIYASPVEER